MKTDFDEVQEVLNASLSVLDKLMALKVNLLSEEAKLFLLSQLKKHLGIIGGFILKYEPETTKRIPPGVVPEKPVKAEDAHS